MHALGRLDEALSELSQGPREQLGPRVDVRRRDGSAREPGRDPHACPGDQLRVGEQPARHGSVEADAPLLGDLVRDELKRSAGCSCGPVSLIGSTTVFDLGPEIPPSAFAPVTVVLK